MQRHNNLNFIPQDSSSITDSAAEIEFLTSLTTKKKHNNFREYTSESSDEEEIDLSHVDRTKFQENLGILY